MDNYGIDMQGVVLVQRVDSKEEWTTNDIGRVILDVSTGLFWVGATTIESGHSGWIPLGIYDRSIKYRMIDWDDALEGYTTKVSSLNIPCLYGDSTSTVQTAVNSILDEITALSRGETIQSTAIKSFHLDTEGTYRISAKTIPIENVNGYFPAIITTTEDALDYTVNRSAEQVPLQTDGGFGSVIGFTSQSVQSGLVDIEEYLANLTADNISATYPLSPTLSTVQFVLDAHYQLIKNINFKDLIGTPLDYGISGQVLVTDGVDSVCFTDLIANSISCQYPQTTDSNVQAAIWGIQQDIYDLQSTLEGQNTLDATQITYNGNDQFSDIDSVVDYLLTTSYRSDNSPDASDISSIGIGDTNNVQDALVYLSDQFGSLMSQLPCQVISDNIDYISPAGHSNVRAALDYLFSLL